MRRYVLPLLVAVLLVVAGCTGSNSGGLGLSAGGAADANAFRHNVQEGYVPQPTDVTAEGLFHDYYFETGQSSSCEQLFCPSYTRGVSEDPLSNETERYLTVGLNSGLEADSFERKTLNLVVVLDTSGSMGSQFTEYYYDDGEKRTVSEESTKMQVAREAVSSLTTHLEGDDRFGLVTYSNRAKVVQSLDRVDETDMESLRGRIDGVGAGGGTNLDAGMGKAESILEPYRDADQSEYETRIIYVTDAMPNLGDTSGDGLGARVADNAAHDVHSTFVGVGVDFNTELVETINEVPGANHYTVHSPRQFRERMDEGFDYMVTPLVFNLSLSLESSDYDIAEVYGSPTADEATGEMLSVNTLFPSRTEDNRTEGGVILAKLNETGEGDRLALTARYETRTGETKSVNRTLEFGNHTAPYYETDGVRKAIALSRYADLMRNWAAYERARDAGEAVTPEPGIEHRDDLGQWEQRSVGLRVSSPYDERISRFESYFRAEKQALGADRMARDLEILEQLTNATADTTTATAESPTATADPPTPTSG